MNTMAVLLLAAAAAGDGFGYDSPGVGLKHFLRPHAVVSGPAPPGGMIGPGAAGCQFGHPGCQGGQSCPGARGAAGAGGAGAGGAGAGGRRFANVRSQIYFLDPDGMKIGWQSAGANGERVYLASQLTVPARYNFLQGYIYRLKITDIPARPGVALYPTIEIAPSTPATDAYLTHNPIPVQFTAEDFDQVVDGGNFVTKVLYLPDPKYQELAIAGVETLVSTRLEPGVDPILEADKRGTILLIVRLGAIDLEMPSTAATTVPANAVPGATGVAPNALPGGTMLPPGTLPPGVVTTPAPPNVPLETAPATPAIIPPPPPAVDPAAPPTPPPTTPPIPKEEVPTEAAPKPAAPAEEAPKEEAPKVEAPAAAPVPPAEAPAPAPAPDAPKH